MISAPMTDGLPTARTTLRASYVRVLVFCNRIVLSEGGEKAALLPTGGLKEGGEVLGRIAAGFIGLQRQPNASDQHKESRTRRSRAARAAGGAAARS